jgi:hypothetical protein
VVRPGGDIIVAGAVGERLALVDLGPDGRPRRSFGHEGSFTCACGGTRPHRLDVILHRGHLYVLDDWVTTRGEGIDLVKVTGAGRLDRSFAGRGYRPVALGITIGLFAQGNRLLALGLRNFHGPSRVRAFRLDGRVDRSFESPPAVVAGGYVGSGLVAAAQQPGGRVVLVGEGPGGTNSRRAPLELLGLG